MSELFASLRGALATLLLCSGVYVTVLLGAAALLAPEGRLGSLVEREGTPIGSRLIAQAFTRPEYVWPRPSAVNYAADAAGGSNLSPANPAVRERAEGILASLNATAVEPAPAELVLASGSGLDPHLTEAGALRQAERVAAARGVPADDVRAAITEQGQSNLPGGLRLVNVLMLNLELDRRFPLAQSRR